MFYIINLLYRIRVGYIIYIIGNIYNIYIMYQIFLHNTYIIHSGFESYVQIGICVCSRAHTHTSHMIAGERN